MAFALSDITDAVAFVAVKVGEGVWDTAVDAASASLLVYGSLLGPAGIPAILAGVALPGLARGEPTDRAIATGLKYQALRGLNFLKRYGASGDPQDAAKAAEGRRKLEAEYEQPIMKWSVDPALKSEVERAKGAVTNAGIDLDAALAQGGLSPEKLAVRMGSGAREDAAAMTVNILAHAPFYDPDWFDPGSGKFITDLDDLRSLRAIARSRFAPPNVIAVLDRRIDGAEQARGIAPPDIQTIVNSPWPAVTSGDLARVLASSRARGATPAVLVYVNDVYEQKLAEERSYAITNPAAVAISVTTAAGDAAAVRQGTASPSAARPDVPLSLLAGAFVGLSTWLAVRRFGRGSPATRTRTTRATRTAPAALPVALTTGLLSTVAALGLTARRASSAAAAGADAAGRGTDRVPVTTGPATLPPATSASSSAWPGATPLLCRVAPGYCWVFDTPQTTAPRVTLTRVVRDPTRSAPTGWIAVKYPFTVRGISVGRDGFVRENTFSP